MCSGEDALAVGRGNKEWRLELHLIKSESVASGVVRSANETSSLKEEVRLTDATVGWCIIKIWDTGDE